MIFSWDSLANYVGSGGWIMLPLLLVSLLMWAVIVYRLLELRQLCARDLSAEQARHWLCSGQPALAAAPTSLLAQLVREFMARRSGHTVLDGRVLDEAVLSLSGRLDNGLTLVGILAAIAPLLGLLGTVLGMIGTFDSIALFGTGNARAMAGGISEALITTQSGLLIAIPGLYMRNFLQRRVTNLKQQLVTQGIYLKRTLLSPAQEGQ